MAPLLVRYALLFVLLPIATWCSIASAGIHAPGRSVTAPAAVTGGIPDGGGGAIVALREWAHGAITLRVQRVDAAGMPQWGTRGILITDTARESVEPALAGDGTGSVVVAWTESEENSSTSRVFAQKVSAEGVPQWAPGGVLLTSNAERYADPAIVSAIGGAIVAWVDRSGYSPTDIYAQRVDASGIPRWAANGQALCTAWGQQSEPAIVASGTGGAIITWTDYRNGFARDLYAQRVNASGVLQWAYDGAVICLESSDQEAPAVVADGGNGAVMTWSDPRNGTYDLFAQHLDSAGNALWGDGKPVCMALGDQRNPRAVADGAAGAVIAWEDSRFGNLDVCAQRVLASGDTAWVPAAPVCMAGGDQGEVSLAYDTASGAIVTWLDPRAGSIPGVYAQRVDVGGAPQWAPDGVPVCAEAVAVERFEVVPDGSGGAIVTWAEHRGFDLEIYGQRLDAGGVGSWAPEGVAILADPGVQRAPVQIADGAGGTIVALHQKLNGVYKVYLRKYDSTGLAQWPWIAACSAPGLQVLPSITTDGAGGAIVAWVDGRGGLADGDIYAQRVGAGGVRMWDEGGVALCVRPGLQFQAAITSDGAGGAIVTWMDTPWGGDIYAQRVDAAGVPLWTAGGVTACSPPGFGLFPDELVRDVITSDGAGGAIVTWTDWRAGSHADVYAQRVDAGGARGWATDGVAISTAAGDQRNATVTTDAAGGAILAWDDRQSGMPAVFAQRVTAAGDPLWAAGGVTLSGTTFAAMAPGILPDGSGGAIVAWTGYASPGTEPDIFVQRVNSAGTRLWTPRDGRALCIASGVQREASLASDGSGGAIVAWLDFRAGNGIGDTDLYAQRILSTGSTFWAYNGVPLCTAAGAQVDPVLIPDGAHGMIAAWQDGRDNGKDFVHFQRLNASGSPLWADGATVDVATRVGPNPTGLAISGVLPNPVRREMTVSLSLPRGDAAALELLDVAGRRILSRQLDSSGDGFQSVRLTVPPETAPGVYMLRVAQAGQATSRKVCVLR